MAEKPTDTARPDEAWEIRYARRALAESKTAEQEITGADSIERSVCAFRQWGRLEAALEALVEHIDRQGGHQ